MIRRAAILVFVASLAAQDTRFDVRSRLVLVPVNVKDGKDRSIIGLEAPDFLLFDNGRPQKVIVDSIDTGVAPIALVIAVQSSGISAAVVEKVQKIGAMIQPLVTGERGCAALVSFAERINWLQECTKDPDALDRAFRALRPMLRPGEDKSARMLDTVQAAIERLRRQPNARRVLLLISESRDRNSQLALDVVTFAAQSAGVTVYAATYSAFRTAFTSKGARSERPRALKPKTPNDVIGNVNGYPPGLFNPFPSPPPPEHQVDLLAAVGEWMHLHRENTTKVLTEATGGATFSFLRQEALEEAIDKLGAELHSQYVLSFVPEASPQAYHRLEVKVARRGQFEVRARPSYWSSDEK